MKNIKDRNSILLTQFYLKYSQKSLNVTLKNDYLKKKLFKSNGFCEVFELKLQSLHHIGPVEPILL